MLGVWLKCLAPVPPRLYPPAERGKAPPVRLGRSVDENGAAPRRAIALPVFEAGEEEELKCPAVRRLGPEQNLGPMVANQRCWECDWRRKALE